MGPESAPVILGSRITLHYADLFQALSGIRLLLLMLELYGAI